RCCPYCNFCCNGMRPAGQGKRKKRETKAEIESAASPTHAAAAAALHVSAPTARSQMLAESQRAFVKRAKRQNSRNREVRQYPMCPCAWCNSRSVDNNRTPHSPRDREPQHADYSRSGAHPDNYPRGSRGNSSPCHSPHYPDYTSPDRPRFRSYASASAPQDRADAGTRYGKPYELSARTDNNQYPNGGPVRGSGPFARALQMSSPLSWMRTWLTDQVRMRNGMLGY
ncbi:hypothetical protein PFISCL1PPCAC_28853, partial [Pristionchus fissidentatus]